MWIFKSKRQKGVLLKRQIEAVRTQIEHVDQRMIEGHHDKEKLIRNRRHYERELKKLNRKLKKYQ